METRRIERLRVSLPEQARCAIVKSSPILKHQAAPTAGYASQLDQGPKRKAPARAGAKDSVRGILRVDYLHSVGAYLARMPPTDAAAAVPWAAAVALPAEVHAQSIAPVWPVARAAPLI